MEGRRADVVLRAEDLHGRARLRLLQNLEHLPLAESTRSHGFDDALEDSSYELSNFRGSGQAKLSAFAGCYAGQTTLGIHYINGDAVPQDLDVANAWLKIASEDPDGGLVSMYINKIAPYVDKKRSAEIEALIRSDLKKVTTSPSVQNGATK